MTKPVPKKSPPKKWPRVLLIAAFVASCLFVLCGLLLWFLLSPMQKIASGFDVESLRKTPKAIPASTPNSETPIRSPSDPEIPRSPLLPHLPDHLVQGILENEDARFLMHGGVDYGAILRASFTNAKAGGIVHGGSTITQQLARNAFELGEKSFRRKITEALLARRIEGELSKAEILEAYLDALYFGDKIHGIDDAARSYFGHGAEDLTLNESAALIAMIKAPNKLSPRRHPEANEEARKQALTNLRNAGKISQEEFNAAQGETLNVLPATAP